MDVESSRFFSDHLPVEPLSHAIRKFVIREDQRFHFSEEYSGKIGIPRWDKIINIYSRKKAGINYENASYDSTISYIPFVKDSQFQVNACLIIKTMNNDTSFRILYQNEYDDFGLDKARNIFHLFASMENRVFGTEKFSITDDRLLTNTERAEITNAGLGQDDIAVTYTLKRKAGTQNTKRAVAIEQCYLITYCIQYGLKPFKAGPLNQHLSVNNTDEPCISWGSYTECWTEWIDIPDGWGYVPDIGIEPNNGGDGSGGSGSNWPLPFDPTPCKSGRLTSACEGNGWEPLTPDQVLAFEDILAPDDSFEYNVFTDPSFQTVNSLYEFQVYKDAIGNLNNTHYDLSIPSIILSQQEKIKRGRYNLNFVGGVDVDVTLEKIDGFWKIKEVESDTWGFTPMTSWHQTATRKNLTGNEITLDVFGKLHYNVIIDGIGTIYKQDFKFRLKFNNATGELISISRF
ncbi:MAG TPA: hypothetical protein VHN59_16415 [Chitinophagaceae bacterium]|nr:hypothetical protein [Chitinophagaceae bacterium]